MISLFLFHSIGVEVEGFNYNSSKQRSSSLLFIYGYGTNFKVNIYPIIPLELFSTYHSISKRHFSKNKIYNHKSYGDSYSYFVHRSKYKIFNHHRSTLIHAAIREPSGLQTSGLSTYLLTILSIFKYSGLPTQLNKYSSME